jgi:hypothetical protein
VGAACLLPRPGGVGGVADLVGLDRLELGLLTLDDAAGELFLHGQVDRVTVGADRRRRLVSRDGEHTGVGARKLARGEPAGVPAP